MQKTEIELLSKLNSKWIKHLSVRQIYNILRKNLECNSLCACVRWWFYNTPKAQGTKGKNNRQTGLYRKYTVSISRSVSGKWKIQTTEWERNFTNHGPDKSHGWFMSVDGKNHYNIVKQLASN